MMVSVLSDDSFMAALYPNKSEEVALGKAFLPVTLSSWISCSSRLL